ncbi:PREDICTED: uncharacterized protein LOC104980495 [Bison bison bison]|uniref:Uncharacterized protein LOC104980495 n=1 Tax=Bison bison bison TaxID=43346 RepID=A0A6P3GD96_BISBB|nr:PREDICTED: uncharacterized protein LOC104980495 [Bison bison bison]
MSSQCLQNNAVAQAGVEWPNTQTSPSRIHTDAVADIVTPCATHIRSTYQPGRTQAKAGQSGQRAGGARDLGSLQGGLVQQASPGPPPQRRPGAQMLGESDRFPTSFGSSLPGGALRTGGSLRFPPLPAACGLLATLRGRAGPLLRPPNLASSRETVLVGRAAAANLPRGRTGKAPGGFRGSSPHRLSPTASCVLTFFALFLSSPLPAEIIISENFLSPFPLPPPFLSFPLCPLSRRSLAEKSDSSGLRGARKKLSKSRPEMRLPQLLEDISSGLGNLQASVLRIVRAWWILGAGVLAVTDVSFMITVVTTTTFISIFTKAIITLSAVIDCQFWPENSGFPTWVAQERPGHPTVTLSGCESVLPWRLLKRLWNLPKSSCQVAELGFELRSAHGP